MNFLYAHVFLEIEGVSMMTLTFKLREFMPFPI